MARTVNLPHQNNKKKIDKNKEELAKLLQGPIFVNVFFLIRIFLTDLCFTRSLTTSASDSVTDCNSPLLARSLPTQPGATVLGDLRLLQAAAAPGGAAFPTHVDVHRPVRAGLHPRNAGGRLSPLVTAGPLQSDAADK